MANGSFKRKKHIFFILVLILGFSSTEKNPSENQCKEHIENAINKIRDENYESSNEAVIDIVEDVEEDKSDEDKTEEKLTTSNADVPILTDLNAVEADHQFSSEGSAASIHLSDDSHSLEKKDVFDEGSTLDEDSKNTSENDPKMKTEESNEVIGQEILHGMVDEANTVQDDAITKESSETEEKSHENTSIEQVEIKEILHGMVDEENTMQDDAFTKESSETEDKSNENTSIEQVEIKVIQHGMVDEENTVQDDAITKKSSETEDNSNENTSIEQVEIKEVFQGTVVEKNEEHEDESAKEDTGEKTHETIFVEEELKDSKDLVDNTEDENVENPEEDLTMDFEIPINLRDRSHILQTLNLKVESQEEKEMAKCSKSVLNDLKNVYENAIKPLEQMYKYRDLSNRHFGDPEIFAKPLIVFMGPWSGGKSTILNYLTDNEYTPYSIRSGAEPSPAQFNILMHGNNTEVLDGTQIAADWTFSGLQKFGQSFLDRLRAVKMPSELLEKVNIVEIPGILEVRKQVVRLFPFNDACQWFIDRADLIFLVYDPSKLDVGPETEAVLDQIKGREYQTRILLNKADQVKPEELLRVQNALIWNISPLMSSSQPPLLYTVSLWSHPYEVGAPIRLLRAQEKALLMDLRDAIDKRIENKIASARRFAVRVRNHAKMIDCYLTTYYNHKSLFSNKKEVARHIIENPQQYHIYEGLSTLTNISRYDLPDPEIYKEFFNLNPLYTFKRLSETCTYFRGCPINKLDVAIAYDLPELVGKYKNLIKKIKE